MSSPEEPFAPPTFFPAVRKETKVPVLTIDISTLRGHLRAIAEYMSAIDFSSIEDPQQRSDDIQASIVSIIGSQLEEKAMPLTKQTITESLPMPNLMRAYLACEMVGELDQMLDDSSIDTGSSLRFHGSPPSHDGEMRLNDLLNLAKGLSAPASNPIPLRHMCLSYLLVDMNINFHSREEIIKTAINTFRLFEFNPFITFIGKVWSNVRSNEDMHREDRTSKLSAQTAAAIRSVTPAVELSFPLDRQIGMKTFHKLLECGLRNAGINPPETLALPGPSIRFGGQ